MDIFPIQNEPMIVNTQRIIPTAPKEGNVGKSVQESGTLPRKDSLIQNQSTWSELQKINDSSNEVAPNKRNGDKISERVEEYVDRMKAHLERIIKNFPPFPPGGEERVNLLRDYAGFRKLIDQLTVPPPEKSIIVQETPGVLSPADSLAGANHAVTQPLGNPEV